MSVLMFRSVRNCIYEDIKLIVALLRLYCLVKSHVCVGAKFCQRMFHTKISCWLICYINMFPDSVVCLCLCWVLFVDVL